MSNDKLRDEIEEIFSKGTPATGDQEEVSVSNAMIYLGLLTLRAKLRFYRILNTLMVVGGGFGVYFLTRLAIS